MVLMVLMVLMVFMVHMVLKPCRKLLVPSQGEALSASSIRQINDCTFQPAIKGFPELGQKISWTVRSGFRGNIVGKRLAV